LLNFTIRFILNTPIFPAKIHTFNLHSNLAATVFNFPLARGISVDFVGVSKTGVSETYDIDG